MRECTKHGFGYLGWSWAGKVKYENEFSYSIIKISSRKPFHNNSIGNGNGECGSFGVS